MKLSEQDLEIDFTDAITMQKFDDSNHGLTHCMKAVDFIVELAEAYLFIEIKDPSNPNARQEKIAEFQNSISDGRLCKSIVKKFRDSFIYRWAEDKLNKPFHFISIITLEEALLNHFNDELQRQLPVQGPDCWKKQLVSSCNVMNIEAWNRNFTKWPLVRLSNNISNQTWKKN